MFKSVRITKRNNGRTMPLSKCEVWKVKKPRFIKKETSGLLSKLGIKKFLSKVPKSGDILVYRHKND